ncbi:hypothetical protein GOP47_0020795 [Adiantum capillus-veneris]|uniref:Uncharacterized protein n=1 Tax=Adiantum capillus-veneris TaxID=13818 RepID=A0A9D4UAD3_ADICA|nr:hypothetical protein GOP47_0020795 [Adiantum capillus-veneris]
MRDRRRLDGVEMEEGGRPLGLPCCGCHCSHSIRHHTHIPATKFRPHICRIWDWCERRLHNHVCTPLLALGEALYATVQEVDRCKLHVQHPSIMSASGDMQEIQTISYVLAFLLYYIASVSQVVLCKGKYTARPASMDNKVSYWFLVSSYYKTRKCI